MAVPTNSVVASGSGSLSTTITRLLIANRGEITARIARTAHRLGISTVGVYSEPDADALHVDAVDIAVALGGSTPAESYLRAEAIIEIALAHGCQAIHPGYGFLAENADVAEQVSAAGLIWVGPTAEQIRTLGDKVAAKKLAIESGVPTAPLFEVSSAADGSVDVPEGIPMPALVKAAAGGGGRGMRVVRTSDELAEAVTAGSREAQSSFGDGTVFVEPFIERARHVEVQIIGDSHGNVVHLGERECSIQRRNQKIVEESPSAGITPETRAAICDGAVALARSVGYEGAGTVEFLVDEAGRPESINFLEVNTRLQVEHPVTEAVTGVDLVELQLRVAAGEALPISQSDVQVDGHAIEVRVVAEDPAAGWLPSTGTITAFELGVDGDLVRIDTGFRADAEVSSDYDSMLAKVIAHGATRVEAAAKLRRALRGSEISGVTTNLAALVEILGESDYLAAHTPTAYLDEHPDVVASVGPTGDDRVGLLLAAVFATERASRAADRVTGFAPSGWRNLRTQGQRQVWSASGSETPDAVEYTVCGAAAEVLLGPWPEPLDDGTLPPDERRRRIVRLLSVTEGGGRTPSRIAIEIDGVRRVVEVHGDEDAVRTRSVAGALTWALAPRFVDHDAEAAGGGPICPLPGTVIAVHVAEGDEVEVGAVLMVVEAMKMEHKITAATDSTVTEIHFDVGSRVDQGDLLVSLEALADD
ncbi:acetyl/propionyl/methylcrotonyl-CoA carboxylase subunit alpha [Ilumatobacter nonamiensis]|uniref:acetyl/propionyl/methylcrotonyl-CoA carboxylase subunit alpha n=1 Tax=Ilumatobacter nonamiensis TaxID=467093 RepID=UPI000686874D|nr:biotin carboxylase N-terminal domain-containing protein [Ilumatobacter nonamiensis]